MEFLDPEEHHSDFSWEAGIHCCGEVCWAGIHSVNTVRDPLNTHIDPKNPSQGTTLYGQKTLFPGGGCQRELPVLMAPCKMLFSCILAASLLISSRGTDTGEEINETIICTKDLIGVEIPSTFFLSKNPPILISDLHLNDPECHGTQVENLYVFSIKTNFTDCGTRVDSDGAHIIFINTIQNNFSDIITRTFINITFACRYPINYMVQQPNEENKINVDIRTITLNTEDGNFSVSMVLYKDQYFEDMWTTIPFLTLEDNIFVKIKMVPDNLIIRVENCWSTPTKDPIQAIQYSFIKDSCPQAVKDKTLSVITNGEGEEAMFRIQMFKFVGLSYNHVFLHCTVQICQSTAAICKPIKEDFHQ
ncbi:pancreatic secretory granule membrane major glycoprotein GP2-like isoform X2 [Hemicordylus capensis]|uniref:pancreatic secretory granule membrane major glycoprotein GP2-like isoform X2 n=1 Tax=Hemicordylus capensis TaxID=884348 RepID=UPI002302E2CB|nr:pancreatic secretory granule membrane major glycoprotein GP2-like isoform X2 [Hemicordylus capensis]